MLHSEGLKRVFVCLMALALVDGLTVPREAVSLQGGENEVGGSWLFAWWIDILNTKKPEPVMGPGLQVAGYGGNERAEMQRAGRRWCKPADVWLTGNDRPDRGTGARRVPDAPGLRGTRLLPGVLRGA